MNDYKELLGRLHNDFQKIYNCCFNCLQLTPGAVICEVGKGNIAMMLRELSDASDAIEQLVRERDAAVEAAENIHSDFAGFACAGIDNLAPYCGNRCPECIDESGWCKDVTKFCKGFISAEYTEWRGVQE